MPLLLAMLLAADPSPDDEAPFFENGGIHFMIVQSIHGLALGPAIVASANNNTGEDKGGLIAPAIAVPLAYVGFGIVGAHWLRPSVLTTYESAMLGWAGALAGISVADAYVEARRRSFNLNWLWPTRLIAGSVGHLLGSLVALVPRQVDPPGWRTWVTVGGAVTGFVITALITTSRPARDFDPTISFAYVMPFALGCGASVILRALSPQEDAPQIAPMALANGAGVSIAGRW